MKSYVAPGVLVVSLMISQHVDAGPQLKLLSNTSANQPGGASAGEIVAFDKDTDRLFVTSSGLADATVPINDLTTGVYRVNIFNIANPSAPTAVGTIDFTTTFGTPADMLALSSVAVDPQSRFGVAALIPRTSTTTAGRVGFFNLDTGAVIGTAAVGFHPDSLAFSADGSKLVVVNEGEFVSGATNAPGSISVFDVSGIDSSLASIATLPSLVPVTRDFSDANLDVGVNLTGVRNSNIAAVGTSGTFINAVPDFNAADTNKLQAIEPEYATIVGNKVYVSLQDNNAIGEYDLTTNKWTGVDKLGTITQTVDATDNGSTISITQSIKGMPMPDTVGSYVVGGKTYIVSANEGDARVDDRDVSRFGDVSGNDSMNSLVDTDAPSNFLNTGTNASNGIRSDTSPNIGRLNVSRIDGDTDNDTKIDDIHMFGTRSFTIWEETAGGLVKAWDSGSFFETYIRDNDAAGWVDSRSDDKGPEPEGLTLGVIDGRTYAFIGMERTHGIFMFDVTDPLAPVFEDYLRISDGSNSPLRPEGFTFVSAADSPTGFSMLIVGFEGEDPATLFSNDERFVILGVIPEPSSLLLLGFGAAAMLRRIR